MQHIELAAFNLRQGAAFTTENAASTYVVTQVLYRHANTERIGVLVRILGEWVTTADGETKVPVYDTFSFHYCDEVFLLGLVVNEDSWDDFDFGQFEPVTSRVG